MNPEVRLTLLGDFSIRGPNESLPRLPTRKTRALAAYLALQRGRRFSRNHLCDLLWCGQTERRSRQSLRQALSAVRSAFGTKAIVGDEDFVICRPDSVTTDVDEFQSLARAGTLAAAHRAHAIYGGDLLRGQEIEEPAFAEWLQAERERLCGIARKIVGSILVDRCRDRNLIEAMDAARALLKLDPFDEGVHRTVMQLHAQGGRTNAALQHFQDFSRMLRREIGVVPEDETFALYESLTAQRASLPGLDTLDEYAFVLEQMAHCVVVTDASSRIVGWNRAAEAEFGFSKDFMFGRKPTLVYAPIRDQSIADGVLKYALERGHWSSRVKLLSMDGRECQQTRTVQPLYDRRGHLIGAFGTGVPV
jgi:PAS domain S-box-containing protein